MNSRQAAKAAAKRIEECERIMALNKADIIDYNNCILHMIRHGSPCDYCNDLEECREAGKDLTIGCDDWMLRMKHVSEEPAPEGGEPDEQEAGGQNVSIFGVEEQ